MTRNCNKKGFAMCPKNLLVALVAMAIAHASEALGSLRAARATAAERPGEVSASTVVVVKNLNNADSVAIPNYYASKRQLPAENVCAVRITDVEE